MADEELDATQEPEVAPEPEERLVAVFDTSDDSEALVVRGLLESNGIEVVMNTPEAPVGVFPISTSDLGEVRLLVREELAEQARRIIRESAERGPEAAEEAERQTET